MRITAFIGALGLATTFGATAEAQALSCGGEYVIKRGDSLQKITRLAYGGDLSWSYLYNANKSVIGGNPSQIEIGMRLSIPCRDGQAQSAAAPAATRVSTTATAATAATTTEAAATPTVRTTPAATNVSIRQIPNRVQFRIVTGSDWAPFTNHEQDQGGMITDVVQNAMSRVAAGEDYKIDHVNDWSAHLQPLLSDVAYDFSIPWFKPNCDVIDKLGEDAQLRCKELEFSDPIYEMITGYFVRADAVEKPRSHAALTGKKVCRAQGYATYMLEEFDVRPPAIEYVRPVFWRDCFEKLASGEVDVLYISTTAADDLIADLNLSGQVEEVPELAYVTTMHAVTSVNNPRAREQIAVINDGLRQIREDGTWFQIVQKHLVEHARKTSTN